MLYGWVFYSVQLYADVTLQVFFIASSIAGWVNWLKGNHGSELAVRKTPIGRLLPMLAGALVVAGGYAWLLHRFTNAWSPWLDSAIMVFSVLAQFMLMGRRLESWYFWLLVNTIAVPLYAARDLWLTAGLYLVFGVTHGTVCTSGARRWSRDDTFRQWAGGGEVRPAALWS